jgi:hypothetical protein
MVDNIDLHNNMNLFSVKPNVDYYCLMFDREEVDIVVAGDIVDHYCLMFDRRVVHIIVARYIVDQYCFMFDRGVEQ